MTSDHLTDLEDIARQLQAPDLTQRTAVGLSMDLDDAIRRAIHAGYSPEDIATAAGVKPGYVNLFRGARP